MRNKLTNLVLIFIILFSLTIIRVNALSSEQINLLDVNNGSNISIPSLVSNKGTEVTIIGVSNYKLYFQWKKISMEEYNNIDNNLKEVNNYIKEANDYILNNKPESNDSQAQEIYKNKVEEYIKKEKELESQYYSSIPSWDDNWQLTQDNKVYLPSDVVGNNQPYIMFLKLENLDTGQSVYDFGILKINGSDEEVKIDVTDDSNTDDSVTENIINENSTNNISDEKNPSTSDISLSKITVILLSTLLLLIFSIKQIKKVYKKNN